MTPVTVLTGFLGSGKTTLLAALLRHPRLQDTAVIINEFGEAGLDHLLVKAVATLESTPRAATHWSTRSMAKASGVSISTVHRIWRAFSLQPHRTETFKLSTDPLFVDKVRDIVGLYLDPPDHALVLCLDEKSQIQALDRTHPPLPFH